MNVYPLGRDWEDEAQKEGTAKRILALSDEQIWKLFEKVGITWGTSEEIMEEIRNRKMESANLDTLLTEPDSKENLLKWVTHFEESK